jgi:8-oxo-dGTP pyrophosphatase MutT (NUDIX family)
MTMDEIVTIVDRMNKIVGSAPRSRMRSERLTHRATYLLVISDSGELFVQKRTLSKDVYPGFYDPATGGVVLKDESYESAAARELKEELGIVGVPIEFHGDFFFEDQFCSVWGRVFSCKHSGPFVLQAEEVAAGEFMRFEDVFRRATEEPFTPDSLEAVQLYRRLQLTHA